MKKNMFWILICLGCSGFAQKPVSIIFDTDIAPDYDDVGAMALLHAFADQGEAATIDEVVFVGSFTRYLVSSAQGERLAIVQQNDRPALARGSEVKLAWRDEDACQLSGSHSKSLEEG